MRSKVRMSLTGACILPDVEMIFLVEELVKGNSLQALLHRKLELTPNEKHAVLLGICRPLSKTCLHLFSPSPP